MFERSFFQGVLICCREAYLFQQKFGLFQWCFLFEEKFDFYADKPFSVKISLIYHIGAFHLKIALICKQVSFFNKAWFIATNLFDWRSIYGREAFCLKRNLMCFRNAFVKCAWFVAIMFFCYKVHLICWRGAYFVLREAWFGSEKLFERKFDILLKRFFSTGAWFIADKLFLFQQTFGLLQRSFLFEEMFYL